MSRSTVKTRDVTSVTPRQMPDNVGTVASPALAVARLDFLEVHGVLLDLISSATTPLQQKSEC